MVSLLPRAPDHRWEGVVVGGVLLSVGGALLANGYCDMEGSDGSCLGQTVAGFAIGGIVGAGLGGLVGGLIPKASAPEDQAEP